MSQSGASQSNGVVAREAWDEALAWANGHKSHHNLMLEMEASSEHRAQTLVAIAQADAAEVVKWSALAVAAAQLEQIEASIRP